MRIARIIAVKSLRLQRLVFLCTSYILGIGLVSLVGKALGADFLDETATKTNWKRPTGSTDVERMY